MRTYNLRQIRKVSYNVIFSILHTRPDLLYQVWIQKKINNIIFLTDAIYNNGKDENIVSFFQDRSYTMNNVVDAIK